MTPVTPETRPRMQELIAQYGDPLKHIDRVPRAATELYLAWSGVKPSGSLNRRQRNERRHLAHYLQYVLAAKGEIVRSVIMEDGHTAVAFWLPDES